MKNSKYPDERKHINNVLSKADELSNNIFLSSIRIDDINEKINKITCKGQIYIDKDIIINISYTAQYTEENQLFVEVFGLK